MSRDPRENPYAEHERRDRAFCRALLGGFGGLLVAYLCADAAGVLPAAVSVRAATQRRNRVEISDRYEEYDPDLVLGIAVGDTRFRLNYAKCRAIVTRPVFGVTEWIIPSSFELQGRVFTVTALDPFAFLNAQGVHTISLPPTLRYTNQAERFSPETLRQVKLRRADGSETTLTPPLPSPLIPEPQEDQP